LKTGNALVEVIKDETGKVSKLVLNQGGKRMEGRKK